MHKLTQVIAVIAMLGLAGPAAAERVALQNGSDSFVAGAQINERVNASGDAFVAGRTLRLQGDAGGDLHVSGYDVNVDADTSQDLYVLGVTVVLRGAIAQDLTAAAVTLRTEKEAATQGNARLIGNSVVLDGPIAGSAMITGRDVILNSEISGDVRILAQTLSFGPDAKIGGALTYSTEDKIAVPERVAPAARVVFEPVSSGRLREEWEHMGREMPVLPTFASIVFGFVVSLLFFVVLAALMLAFMPKRLARMRRSITEAPGQTLLLGVIGLSILFGMVPITALTIIGLPFAPIVLLAIVVAWTLGYALGAYSIALRIWSGLGGDEDPTTVTRLLVFAAAITLIALLNFIPFLGWVANYTLVLVGIGAMTRALFQSLIGTTDAVLDIDMKTVED